MVDLRLLWTNLPRFSTPRNQSCKSLIVARALRGSGCNVICLFNISTVLWSWPSNSPSFNLHRHFHVPFSLYIFTNGKLTALPFSFCEICFRVSQVSTGPLFLKAGKTKSLIRKFPLKSISSFLGLGFGIRSFLRQGFSRACKFEYLMLVKRFSSLGFWVLKFKYPCGCEKV